MGKNAYRKPRPAIPNWAWLDRDGCWFCKNRNNCNSCKANREFMKSYNKAQRKKNRKVREDEY